MAYIIHNDKIEDWVKTTQDKYHAVLSDPPYNLGFMQKAWDSVGGPAIYQEQVKLWGEALLPLLYPGAIVLMFGGTRTWHRLAAGMEDAGYTMWDTIMWLYGQGFPKAQDISKLVDSANGHQRETTGNKVNCTASNNTNSRGNYNAEYEETIPSDESKPWAGHKTRALKPSWEPILCFAVPTDKNYADNALEYGTGCLNIDGARIGNENREVMVRTKTVVKANAMSGESTGATGIGEYTTNGRYPANIVLDEESAKLLDERAGYHPTSGRNGDSGSGKTGMFVGSIRQQTYFDSGGASRFFYNAKADTAERNAGCDELPDKPFGFSNQALAEIERGTTEFDASIGMGEVKLVKNAHPCVKPIDLNRWLASLLLPPDSVKPRRLLVPFSGSGSEMIGALLAGWDEIVGIEQDKDYCTIAEHRLKFWETNKKIGKTSQEIMQNAKRPEHQFKSLFER